MKDGPPPQAVAGGLGSSLSSSLVKTNRDSGAGSGPSNVGSLQTTLNIPHRNYNPKTQFLTKSEQEEFSSVVKTEPDEKMQEIAMKNQNMHLLQNITAGLTHPK